ncbi:ABC transporter substrate-binding protein [Sorangium sp. So ce136]|uniref:ABC transporter substrate-binding protein n=1 Tax=Sorangium sp. So ce136 TaxID=3133284 RepID=UPI003F06DB8F
MVTLGLLSGCGNRTSASTASSDAGALADSSQKPAAAAAAPAAHSFRIGLGPWIGYGPLYLALEKGFFSDAGLKVDLVVLTGIAERNSALKSGAIDALAAPVDYFVLAAGNNLESSIVMATDESAGGDGIVGTESIRSVKDLRGKRVAFQRGLPSEFFLRALLAQNGVPFSELKPVDMETAQAGAAFISKQVDAAVVWEPWLTRASEEGNGHVVASTRDNPDLIVDCLGFNKDVVARFPDDVQKVVDSVFRAIEYWKRQPEESNKIMAPHFQVSPEKYAAILAGAKFADLDRNRAYFGTSEAPGSIFRVAERASSIWLEAKVTSAPVRPDSVISPAFVSKAKN